MYPSYEGVHHSVGLSWGHSRFMPSYLRPLFAMLLRVRLSGSTADLCWVVGGINTGSTDGIDMQFECNNIH